MSDKCWMCDSEIFGYANSIWCGRFGKSPDVPESACDECYNEGLADGSLQQCVITAGVWLNDPRAHIGYETKCGEYHDGMCVPRVFPK